MTVPQRKQRFGSSYRAFAAFGCIALGYAGASAASSNTDTSCSDIAKPTLELSANDLETTVMRPDPGPISSTEHESTVENILSTRLFAPAVDADFRDVPGQSHDLTSDDQKPPAMTTRIPGLSDKTLALYKRQMYRKDI